MEMLPVLVCVIAAVLCAFLFESWLRSRKGSGEEIARIYAIVRGRIFNFWSFQYAILIAAVVIIAAGAGFGLGWKKAAACAAGALVTLIPVFAASGSFADGVTAAYNGAVSGDIRQSVRAGYRSGLSLGSWISGLCLISLAAMVFFMKTETVIDYIAPFALGSSVISMILHTGGEVYSSAYSLAVPARDFTDRSGIFIAAGSDYSSSYIVSAASAILLADVAVATSGVTSTFTSEDAVRFPLMVYASGIAGSILGAFLHRAGIGNDPSRGADIGCITAGIVTVAGSVYFSMDLMQSRVYAWSVASGIAAGLILVEISRIFSPDSRIFLNGYKTDKSLGRYSIVIFNLGTGMISTAFAALILILAVGVSYMFASYYGVALCAVGLCAILGSFAAITGLEVAAGLASEIINAGRKDSDPEETSTIADVLDTISVRNGMLSRTNASISGTAATIAAFCALFYLSGEQSIDIMSLKVFGGVMAGIASAFILTGMLIISVRITGRVALRDIGRNDDETGATSALRGAVIPAAVVIGLPILIGLLIGVSALAAFIVSSALTGYVIIVCFNDSGIHYTNTAVQSLSSLIRMMAVFSVAFLAVFMEFGGLLFR